MVTPMESLADEESEETDDSDSMEPGDGEPSPSVPSPPNTRYQARKEKKERVELYTTGRGVVYLPGDINGLTKKLNLLAAVFFAGNTTVRNELAQVLDALLRLKQLTHKEYTNITARLAASL